MQTAILGNPYFLEEQKLSASTKDSQYRLTSGDESRTSSEYLLNALNFDLEQMTFYDVERDRKLTVELKDYKQVGEDHTFAHDRTFLVDSEETGEAKIDMSFSKVEVNVPKAIKFSVSSRYKRVEEK
ncbi:MAG: DUF4292 domain-containing protein [Bacteroidota bacterium]